MLFIYQLDFNCKIISLRNISVKSNGHRALTFDISYDLLFDDMMLKKSVNTINKII